MTASLYIEVMIWYLLSGIVQNYPLNLIIFRMEMNVTILVMVDDQDDLNVLLSWTKF